MEEQAKALTFQDVIDQLDRARATVDGPGSTHCHSMLDMAVSIIEQVRAVQFIVDDFTDPEYGYRGGEYNNRIVADAARDIVRGWGR